MNWKNKQVSFYRTHLDTTGTIIPLGQILFSRKIRSEITRLRQLDRNAPDYEQRKRSIKNQLPCFALNELVGRKQVVTYSGLMQIDFDRKDCEQFDIEEMKQAVFSLPFVCYVSLSCSGDGFFAIAAIGESESQREYAEHIFRILKKSGLSCDESKGRNYNDLRYVSCDENVLSRDEVEPLKISHFNGNTDTKKVFLTHRSTKAFKGDNEPLIRAQLQKIQSAQIGERWNTVQRTSFTLGGLNDPTLINQIEEAIKGNPSFAGQEKKYLKCANECFRAGTLKPLTQDQKPFRLGLDVALKKYIPKENNFAPEELKKMLPNPWELPEMISSGLLLKCVGNTFFRADSTPF